MAARHRSSTIAIVLLTLLTTACGQTARERCYDDCTLRTVLCFNVLDGDYTEKVLFCGQDFCFEACDANARATAAENRERSQRNTTRSRP